MKIQVDGNQNIQLQLKDLRFDSDLQLRHLKLDLDRILKDLRVDSDLQLRDLRLDLGQPLR